MRLFLFLATPFFGYKKRLGATKLQDWKKELQTPEKKYHTSFFS
jgi:hypothetical protein